jgi:hypothetical protein
VCRYPYCRYFLILSNRFRWVYCQLEMLRHCLPPSVRIILYELPETLDETYERVLRDINKANREHALRLLHCLTVIKWRFFTVSHCSRLGAHDPRAGLPWCSTRIGRTRRWRLGPKIFRLRNMRLGIGLSMRGSRRCRRAYGSRWSICLIWTSHIFQHGSGCTTWTKTGWVSRNGKLVVQIRFTRPLRVTMRIA